MSVDRHSRRRRRQRAVPRRRAGAIASAQTSVQSYHNLLPAPLVLPNSGLEPRYLLVKTQRRCHCDTELPRSSQAVITEAETNSDCRTTLLNDGHGIAALWVNRSKTNTVLGNNLRHGR